MNLPEEVQQVIYKLINPTTTKLEIFRGTNMDFWINQGIIWLLSFHIRVSTFKHSHSNIVNILL